MPTFTYNAALPSGKLEPGSIEAADRQKALLKLQGQGKVVLQLEQQSATGAVLAADVGSLFSRVGTAELLDFTSETETLLDAGMPLERALRLQADLCAHPKFKRTLDRLVANVSEGMAFSDALAEEKGVFSPYYISMVRGGEVSGELRRILSRLAEFMRRRQELRGTIISALTYPAIILLVALGAVVLMMTWVVPKFSELFAEGATLPLITRLVLALSDFFIAYWWFLPVGLAVAVGGYQFSRRYAAGRLFWGQQLLALPVLGDLTRFTEAAKFCRMLATLLEGQVPILQGISIVISAAGNEPMVRLLKDLYVEVQAGRPMGRALAGSEAFPEIAAQMIAMGEESGALVKMLNKIADRFEYKVRKTTGLFIGLLEPAIIVFLGAFIGFIVIGIMLAIMAASRQL